MKKSFLIGKPFRPYQTIHWYEISEMRIKKSGLFDLYDRNGRRCVSANANLEGYRQFYQASLRFTRPEYTVKQKTPRTTIRCLRHPAAEHCATGPANITRSSSLYAVVMFLFFGFDRFSGESISGTLQIIREESSTAPFSFRSCLSAPFWHCFMSVCRKSPTTAKNCYFPFPRWT